MNISNCDIKNQLISIENIYLLINLIEYIVKIVLLVLEDINLLILIAKISLKNKKCYTKKLS